MPLTGEVSTQKTWETKRKRDYILIRELRGRVRKLGGMNWQSRKNKETEAPLRCNMRKRDGGELKLVFFSL